MVVERAQAKAKGLVEQPQVDQKGREEECMWQKGVEPKTRWRTACRRDRERVTTMGVGEPTEIV